MNETQLCYCDICDETINFTCSLRHNIFKTHTHKKYGTDVKEFIKPDLDEVNHILNDTIKDCRNKYFPSIENRCLYDIKFIIIENNE